MKRFVLALSVALLASACGQDSTDLDYPVTPSAGTLGGAGTQGTTPDNNTGGSGNTINLADGGVGLGDGGTGVTDGGVAGGGDADTTGLPTGIDAGSDTTQDQTPQLPDQIP